MLEKMIRMGELYDFYGQLLTPRQQEFMNLYYTQDFSLGEIAEKFNVSRQAIYDHLRRAEKLLEEYEEKLQLLTRTKLMKKKIQSVKELIEDMEIDQEKREQVLELLGQLLDS